MGFSNTVDKWCTTVTPRHTNKQTKEHVIINAFSHQSIEYVDSSAVKMRKFLFHTYAMERESTNQQVQYHKATVKTIMRMLQYINHM
jgi:hypothetical protein